MQPAPPIDPSALRDLIDIVGPTHVVTDPAVNAGVTTDWTGRFVGSTPAVVRPGTTDEVAAVLDVARRHQLAIVPQGGNTGLVGGSVPLAGELVVRLTRLTSIDTVDRLANQVSVGAGASLAAVQRVAHLAGLRYPIDLAARDSATIGGTIATNAGGLHVVRHGSTRQQLMGVEAVLGNGDRIDWMSGLLKDNTGYHLPSLLCGSEGTLGLVTAARLRLIERFDDRMVALIGFDSVQHAVTAAFELLQDEPAVEAAELFLDAGLRLVCDAFALPAPLVQPATAFLLIDAVWEADDDDESIGHTVADLAGIQDVAVAIDPGPIEALWRYREDHTAAINTLGPPHKLDVTLPPASLAAFIEEIPHRVNAVDPAARTWLFGHVGDGNIHVNVTGIDPADDRVDEAVVEAVAELGGSISAEHGIGTAKVRWLHRSRTTGEIAAMRAIKAALDPDGICNPNVLLPPI